MKKLIFSLLCVLSFNCFAVEFMTEKHSSGTVPRMISGTVENMDKFNNLVNTFEERIDNVNEQNPTSSRIFYNYDIEGIGTTEQLIILSAFKIYDRQFTLGKVYISVNSNTGEVLKIDSDLNTMNAIYDPFVNNDIDNTIDAGVELIDNVVSLIDIF